MDGLVSWVRDIIIKLRQPILHHLPLQLGPPEWKDCDIGGILDGLQVPIVDSREDVLDGWVRVFDVARQITLLDMAKLTLG